MPDTLRPPPGDLQGRRALVTGGAGGIGSAVARHLAARGAHVLVLDRDEREAKAVAAPLGGDALAVDLTDADAVADLDLGDVDVLVNNAGLQHIAPVHELDPARWQQVLDLMLTAPFLLARGVLPGMYERGFGRIVQVSSVHGRRASAFKAPYVAAKHGLEGLSKVLAVEAAGTGVTANAVAPGYVRTPLVEGQVADQAASHGLEPERVLEDVLLARTPAKQLVEPDEVADLVGWLCSPAARSVTGASYVMDGGWSAT